MGGPEAIKDGIQALAAAICVWAFCKYVLG